MYRFYFYFNVYIYLFLNTSRFFLHILTVVRFWLRGIESSTCVILLGWSVHFHTRFSAAKTVSRLILLWQKQPHTSLNTTRDTCNVFVEILTLCYPTALMRITKLSPGMIWTLLKQEDKVHHWAVWARFELQAIRVQNLIIYAWVKSRKSNTKTPIAATVEAPRKQMKMLSNSN